MVSSRLITNEISCHLKNESSKLLPRLGIDKINTVPAFIGFVVGGIFIVVHWSFQQIFLAPKWLISKIS